MIQMQLSDEISRYLTEIKKVRKKNCEPTSNKSIATDAIKALHKAICPNSPSKS